MCQFNFGKYNSIIITFITLLWMNPLGCAAGEYYRFIGVQRRDQNNWESWLNGGSGLALICWQIATELHVATNN